MKSSVTSRTLNSFHDGIRGLDRGTDFEVVGEKSSRCVDSQLHKVSGCFSLFSISLKNSYIKLFSSSYIS